MTPRVVTLWYRAPELLLQSATHTTAVDIWAAGCILGELLLHKPLLPGRTEIQQLEMIIELLGTPHSAIWPQMEQLPALQHFTLKQVSDRAIMRLLHRVQKQVVATKYPGKTNPS